VAAVALYFGKLPTDLDQEQLHDYLFYLQKKSKTPSQSYFKHTVYGLRFLLKSGGTKKQMTLSHEEFIRRFALHILPPKFVKIRHYGFLSSGVKIKLKIHQLKTGILTEKTGKLTHAEVIKLTTGFDVEQCLFCKSGRMIIVMQFGANGPPSSINDKRK
jgi:hypothetical protein